MRHAFGANSSIVLQAAIMVRFAGSGFGDIVTTFAGGTTKVIVFFAVLDDAGVAD